MSCKSLILLIEGEVKFMSGNPGFGDDPNKENDLFGSPVVKGPSLPSIGSRCLPIVDGNGDPYEPIGRTPEGDLVVRLNPKQPYLGDLPIRVVKRERDCSGK